MKSLYINVCLLIAFLLSVNGYAQKEANTWYFGNYAGLDFSGGAPVALTNGKLRTNEGCATICDKRGDLLFYTDGITVYNKNHAIMQNGTGLKGNSSSTQSAIIAPHPGDSSLFYIFTIDAVENGLVNGLQYSVVDISLDNGFGSVTIKNSFLYTPSTEKITAVKHHNGIDFWVISHRFNSDEFLVYKISKTGLNTTPIISAIGETHAGGKHNNPVYDGNINSQGYLKASPKGDKLAVSIIRTGLLEIFDFDTKTGIVSNAKKRPNNYSGAYGVEFSPDGSKLYQSIYSSTSYIFQYDLAASDIFGSQVEIAKTSGIRFGAIQAGPDNKLYIARRLVDYLDVINTPNAKGTACNYQAEAVDLKGKYSYIGLPTLVQSYFRKDTLKCSFTYEGSCFNDTFKFFVTTNYGLENFLWDFGDNSSQNDTATGDTVYYRYNRVGNYLPKLLSTVDNEKCEAQLSLSVKSTPLIILPRDTFLCEGNNFVLTPLQYDGKVSWSTSIADTFPSINITQANTIIATNNNGCGSDKDTITIQSKAKPQLSITSDTIVCPNVPFSASLQSDHKVVSWHDGKFIYNRTFTIADTSILWIKSSNVCGTSYDSVTVNVYPKLQLKINADSAVCPDVDFKLTAISNSDSTINWFNTTTGFATTANIKSAQWVWVTTESQCETKYDSVFIATYTPTTIDLGEDKEICDNTIVLDAGIDGAKYVWQNEPSYNKRTFTVTQPGVYKVAATRCQKTVTDSIIVYPPQDTGVYIPNAFTPNRDLLNDTFSVFIDGFAPQKYQLYIYSRWGTEVFRSENYLQNWDGTFKGQDAPDGVYLYMLNLLHCNRLKQFKGSITLLR